MLLPSRLEEVEQAIVNDQPVDTEKIKLLQALDSVKYGRIFTEQVIARDTKQNEDFRNYVNTNSK